MEQRGSVIGLLEPRGDVVLKGHFRNRCHLDRVRYLGKSQPLLVCRRFLYPRHLRVKCCDDNVLETGHMGKDAHEVAVGILVNAICKVREGLDGLVNGRLGEEGHAAPDIITLDGAHLEAGDNAKVVGSALERSEEVGIVVFVGSDDAPIR